MNSNSKGTYSSYGNTNNLSGTLKLILITYVSNEVYRILEQSRSIRSHQTMWHILLKLHFSKKFEGNKAFLKTVSVGQTLKL